MADEVEEEVEKMNDDDVFDEAAWQKRMEEMDRRTKIMGQRLLQGWTMLGDHCEDCSTPLMKLRTGPALCVACEELGSTSAQAAASEEKSEDTPKDQVKDMLKTKSSGSSSGNDEIVLSDHALRPPITIPLADRVSMETGSRPTPTAPRYADIKVAVGNVSGGEDQSASGASDEKRETISKRSQSPARLSTVALDGDSELVVPATSASGSRLNLFSSLSVPNTARRDKLPPYTPHWQCRLGARCKRDETCEGCSALKRRILADQKRATATVDVADDNAPGTVHTLTVPILPIAKKLAEIRRKSMKKSRSSPVSKVLTSAGGVPIDENLTPSPKYYVKPPDATGVDVSSALYPQLAREYGGQPMVAPPTGGGYYAGPPSFGRPPAHPYYDPWYGSMPPPPPQHMHQGPYQHGMYHPHSAYAHPPHHPYGVPPHFARGRGHKHGYPPHYYPRGEAQPPVVESAAAGNGPDWERSFCHSAERGDEKKEAAPTTQVQVQDDALIERLEAVVGTSVQLVLDRMKVLNAELEHIHLNSGLEQVSSLQKATSARTQRRKKQDFSEMALRSPGLKESGYDTDDEADKSQYLSPKTAQDIGKLATSAAETGAKKTTAIVSSTLDKDSEAPDDDDEVDRLDVESATVHLLDNCVSFLANVQRLRNETLFRTSNATRESARLQVSEMDEIVQAIASASRHAPDTV